MSNDRRGDDRRERLSGRQRAEEHKSGFDRTTFRVPEGTNIFSIDGEGVRRIDIIPYTVPKGGGNPYREDGQQSFERTFHIHRGIGPNNDSYLCPAKLKTPLPCPICEERRRLVKTTDANDKEGLKLIKDLAPKERQLWNVFDHDDEDRGVQIWEYSYHLFGKMLDDAIKTSDEDEGYEYFADPDDGSTLKVAFGEKSMGGNTKFYECTRVDFKKRSEPLDKKLLAAAQPLDNLLILLPYEKLKAIFLQVPEEDHDGDADDAPKGRGGPVSKPKADDDEPPRKQKQAEPETKPAPRTAESVGLKKGDKVEHREHGLCDVWKISPDGTALTLLDGKDEMHKAIGVDEVRRPKVDKADAKPAKEPEPAKQEKPKQEKKADPNPAPDTDTDDWGEDAAADVEPATAGAKGGKGGGKEEDWDSDWS